MSDLTAINLAPPTFREVGTLLVAGVRQYYTYEERGGIPTQWQRFQPYLGNVPGGVGRSAYGICMRVGE